MASRVSPPPCESDSPQESCRSGERGGRSQPAVGACLGAFVEPGASEDCDCRRTSARTVAARSLVFPPTHATLYWFLWNFVCLS